MLIYSSVLVLIGIAAGVAALWLYQRPTVAAAHALIAAQRDRIAALEREVAATVSEAASLRERLHAEQIARAAATERGRAEKESLERERCAFQADRTRMEYAFRAIGTEVLDANTAKVAEVARGVLAEQQALAKGELDVRKHAVEKLIEPVVATLTKLDAQIHSLESKRAGAYEELRTRVEALAQSGTALRDQAEQLSRTTVGLMQALRSSGARGRWGEIQLRRIVELAGMLPHCDFEEQTTIATEAGTERPDMRVILPANRFVIVDAKAPQNAYLEAIEALDDASRGAKLKAHSRAMRGHIDTLARRDYSRHDSRSPDLKIMFVPSEGALAAALTEDPGIIDDAIALGVCIASPTTLIAMLRMMSMGWRQEAIEENARKIAELGSELYERIAKVGLLLNRVGSTLGSTVNAYNNLVGSVETRLLVTARRFRELGVVPAGNDLPLGEHLDRNVRTLGTPELAALASPVRSA